MRKNKNKFSKISLKQLYSDLKKVSGKRTSKFGGFRESFKNVVRKHGKTIAVVGGTTLAVAGTAAAMHYRNEKQLEAKNKEIQSKEQQFHAKELEANAAIQNIKNAQAADKKLLDAEKKQTKKLEERNKLLEQLAKEKEELLVEERRIGAALNKIKISYLRNQIKDTTRSLQDKEAELKEAIANQRVAFQISVAEQKEEKNDLKHLSLLPAPPPPPPPPPPGLKKHSLVIPKNGVNKSSKQVGPTAPSQQDITAGLKGLRKSSGPVKHERELTPFEKELNKRRNVIAPIDEEEISSEDTDNILRIQRLVRAKKEQSNLKRALGISIDQNTISKLAEQEKLNHPVLDRPGTYVLMDMVFGNHLGDNRSMYHFGYTIDAINNDTLKPNQKKLLQEVIAGYQIRKDEKDEKLGIFGKLKLGLVAAKSKKDAMEIINKMLNYLQYIYELKTLEYERSKETEQRLKKELNKRNTAATTIQAVQVQPESSENIAKIAKIQALARGRIARKNVGALKANMSSNLIKALNLEINPTDDDFEEDIKNNPVLNSALMIMYMRNAFRSVSFGKKNKKRSSRFGYNVDNVDKLYLNDNEKILLKYVIKKYDINKGGIIGTLILGLDDAKTIDQELDILNEMLHYLFLLNEYIKTKEQKEAAATRIQALARGVAARTNVIHAIKSVKNDKQDLKNQMINLIDDNGYARNQQNTIGMVISNTSQDPGSIWYNRFVNLLGQFDLNYYKDQRNLDNMTVQDFKNKINNL
jgi:hypothetical protein